MISPPVNNCYNKTLKSYVSLMTIFFLISFHHTLNAQCTLTDAACGGTEMAASGAVTIPAATTYKISAGNTSSATVTFTSNTSKLCIAGTWTGYPVGGSPGGGTIDVYGIVNNNTAWSYNGGSMILNVHVGGALTIQTFDISGGTFTITNCADMTFTGATGISTNGGTFTINNYASINVNGTITSSNSGFVFNNKPGSQMYVGNNFTFSAGTYINDAKLCVTSTSSFSGGTFTNNDCFRTTSYDVSGSGAFTNNNYLTIVGNFSNSGTNNTNNGTMVVTGNYSGSGAFILGAGSLLTCAGWTSSGNTTGPASGCAQIRATGATDLSGTFVAGNSSRVYFDDAGHPAAGFDALSGTKNSIHINDNTCTPTSYPACTMAGSACTTVLPVVLTEFKADCKNGKMEIVWTTASELNNDFFTIERTMDGTTYDAIGIVDSKALNGNSSQTLSYSFMDNSFPKEESAYLNKVFYYRLKQTDFNGQYSYSFISAAGCSNHCIGNIAVVSDNNAISINIQSICSTFVDLSVYNTLGQIVSVKRVFVEAGYNNIAMESNAIAQGLYILKASTINQTLQKKFGKQ
jgi:hypothetical protein